MIKTASVSSLLQEKYHDFVSLVVSLGQKTAEFVAKTKIDKILNPHQVNADEIIENVLIDYGIDDIKIIDLAKEKMTVKKIKRN